MDSPGSNRGGRKGAEVMEKKYESIYKKLIDGVSLLKKENDLLFAKLRKSKFQILKLLIKIVEEIDPYTKGHSLKVYKYAIKIAKKLGLDRKQVRIISRAALLHDIGKIAIDKKVLNKEGKLTDEEFEIIKAHPVIGADIVREVEALNPASTHILYHHVKYNGGGYPKHSFRFDEIPLGARIIAVADSYDAMTSNRPYRKAFTQEYAVSELRKYSGEMYDPNIVETFLGLIANKHI